MNDLTLPAGIPRINRRKRITRRGEAGSAREGSTEQRNRAVGPAAVAANAAVDRRVVLERESGSFAFYSRQGSSSYRQQDERY